MPKTITLRQLEIEGACRPQRSFFECVFGEEVAVSVELAEKYADNFRWWWAAAHLLEMPQLSKFLGAIDTANHSDNCFLARTFAECYLEQPEPEIDISFGLDRPATY
jgi:hypothetical protein